jgi:hypothetical protein
MLRGDSVVTRAGVPSDAATNNFSFTDTTTEKEPPYIDVY